MKYWVDPVQGWRYGFPKVWDSGADKDMAEWLEKHNYPLNDYPDIVRMWPYEEGDDE